VGIWSAYLAIPCILIYYASRRRNLPYKSIFFLFGAFILACGTTHLMDAIIFWWPAYRLAGVLKLFTALISWATVFALAHVAPKAFALRSPEELQREIDGRKKMEELADAMPQMAWMAHANGHAYWHNKRWYDFTGTTPEQMEGWGWQSVYPPEVVPKVQERWRNSVATGEVFEMVLPLRGVDGQYRSVLARTVPLRGSDGSIQRWFGTATDITDRVQLEERLRQSHADLEDRVRQRTLELSKTAEELRHNEQRYRSLVEATTAVVWNTAASGAVESDLPSWAAFTGQTQEQIRGIGWLDAVHPDDRARTAEVWASAVASGQIYRTEYRLRTADGEYRHMMIRGVPVFDEDGNIHEWVGTGTDITEQQRAEQALAKRTAFLMAQLESSVDGILIADSQKNTILQNRQFTEVWKMPAHIAEDASCEARLQFIGGSVRNTEEYLARVDHLYGHPGETAREEIELKDGRILDRYTAPVNDSNGNYHGRIWTFRDITALKHAVVAAEAASRAKSDFLTNMSHEIRTPMTAIVGFSELLLQPAQSLSDRQEALQVIRRNARHLLELINDVLDLSRIEAGKMVTCRTTTDLIHTLGEVASMMRARAVEEGLEFRLRFQGPIPRKIQTDPLRLRQVLINLLGNAIKFTSNGEVRLVVSCPTAGPGSDAPGKDVRFDIADTGIGMTPAQMARLFRPFTQADESTTRKFGGSGLGLDISKRLAHMLGGDITATSIPGVGSTFTLTIDASPMEDVQTVTDATALLLGTSVESVAYGESRITGRVLLAEDGPDNQLLIRHLLEQAGAVVTIAENGRLAVDKAKAGSFDLILMDMQMPELDGYGATSELRRLGIRVPVIALTAHAMSDDREKCMRAGCSDYLTKPLDTDLLLKTVQRHLSQRPQAQPAASAQPPAALPARTDLLRSRFAGDARMIDLIEKFVAALPERVAEMLRLLDAGNLDELSTAVHRLKGSGGGYGFTPISQSAATAELSLKQGLTIDQTRAAVEELVQLIRRVEGYDPARETVQARPASAT
jgi:PAS domain S-box-containing protein